MKENLTSQLQDSGNVTLTYLSNQKGSDGTFSGTRIHGLSKCASAQWNIGDGDYAAASYACAIGDDAMSDTGIHVAKQLWSFIECSKGSTATKKIAVAEVAATQSAAAMAKCDNSEQWVYEHRSDKEVASACADKLKNYESRHPELASRARRMAKRAVRHHHDLAARTHSLATRSEKEYCIVAQDHLGDMSARAIAGKAFNSWNEYTSLRLTDYDSSSVTDEQRWVVTRA